VVRSALFYLGMLILVAVGFEGIRRVGNTLTPPRDIAGQWDFIVPSSSFSCPPLAFTAGEKGGLRVEQSGRYLRLIFSDIHSTQLPARLEDGKLHGSGVSTAPCAADARMHVNGHLVGDHLELSLSRARHVSTLNTSTLVLSAVRPSG